MLKLGASRPWQDAMEALTGQRDILAEPLLNYFQPLYDWLKETNRREGNIVGWNTESVANNDNDFLEKESSKANAYSKSGPLNKHRFHRTNKSFMPYGTFDRTVRK